MNSWTITGNLSADCRLAQMPSGQMAVNWLMGVNKYWMDQSGNLQQATTWVEVSYYIPKEKADRIKLRLKRGAKVLVQGEAGSREFTRADGTFGHIMTIRANYVEPLSAQATAPDGGQQQQPAPQQQQPAAQPAPAPAGAAQTGYGAGYAAPSMAEAQNDDLPF